MEVTIKIGFDLVESTTRHVINNIINVDLNQRASPNSLTDDEYALLDHAFRKCDEALDAIKAQIRITAKTNQLSTTRKIVSTIQKTIPFFKRKT